VGRRTCAVHGHPGQAVNAHGIMRFTGAIDVFVDPTPDAADALPHEEGYRAPARSRRRG
jgi:hypothetical protein